MRGWKTATGTLGWMMCEGAKTLFPEHAPTIGLVQNIFVALGVFGIGHKIDRANMGPYR